MADGVKTRLQRIAHSINKTQVKEAVQSFKSFDRSQFQIFPNFSDIELLCDGYC